MATENIQPLSLQEIDNFLSNLKKKECQWCGAPGWGVHIDNQGGTLLTGNPPGLRNMEKILLTSKDDDSNNLSAEIKTGTETALPLAIAECLECGNLMFFNYFTLMRKIRNTEVGK